MKSFLLAVLVLCSHGLFAQCVAPFQDVNRFVYLFDAGQSNYIENLPLREIQVGRSGMAAYVPQNGRLKLFYQGKTYTLLDNIPKYYMTDNWMLYQNFNSIKVFYNNTFLQIENLFRDNEDMLYYSDSLIAWTNTLGELNIFYNGETQLLERTEIFQAKMGDNIFAYVDRNNNFKVFYQGEIQTLETYVPRRFLVNRNILVYTDMYDNLKFFHDGIITETSTLTPADYRTGENFAAYISNLTQLTVFYKGEEITLLNDRPVIWEIKENMMIWTDKGNNFWCWYKGKKYWLERYVPRSFKMDNDIVVYQDLDGRLKAFYYGEQVDVSDQIAVKGYELYNEAITYSIQPYQTKVWCNKRIYTFE